MTQLQISKCIISPEEIVVFIVYILYSVPNFLIQTFFALWFDFKPPV